MPEKEYQGKYTHIIGNSPAMRKVFDTLECIERVESPVLIEGETGTGKELVASVINCNSVRKGKPFVSYNCAAFSETLLNSELFGHEKGAFTGAESKRTGIFEEADGGTLFLDEIGDMGERAQAMLLRILQDGTFYSLGSSREKKTNVRIITATNKNLREMAAQGLFRKDLFYRINTIQITLPPLREREEDIPLLCTSVLSHFDKYYTSWEGKISAGAMSLLKEYQWPGNVRELKNVIERMVIGMGAGELIEAGHLPEEIFNAANNAFGASHVCANGKKLQKLLKSTEKKIIVEELKKSNGNRTAAANALGISRTNLIAKIRQHNITL